VHFAEDEKEYPGKVELPVVKKEDVKSPRSRFWVLMCRATKTRW
jgi:hypothetical protein